MLRSQSFRLGKSASLAEINKSLRGLHASQILGFRVETLENVVDLVLLYDDTQPFELLETHPPYDWIIPPTEPPDQIGLLFSAPIDPASVELTYDGSAIDTGSVSLTGSNHLLLIDATGLATSAGHHYVHGGLKSWQGVELEGPLELRYHIRSPAPVTGNVPKQKSEAVLQCARFTIDRRTPYEQALLAVTTQYNMSEERVAHFDMSVRDDVAEVFVLFRSFFPPKLRQIGPLHGTTLGVGEVTEIGTNYSQQVDVTGYQFAVDGTAYTGAYDTGYFNVLYDISSGPATGVGTHLVVISDLEGEQSRASPIISTYILTDINLGGGEKGDTGTQGPEGDTGIQGDTGVDGDTGVGIQGDTGPGGGDKGDTGDRGDTGEQGEPGFDGEGVPGDTGVSIQGDTGEQGIPGLDGTSIEGEQGPPGIDGISIQGDTGVSIQGDTGEGGPDGATGVSEQGDTGVTGEQGIPGEAIEGEQGPPGRDGISIQGDTGVTGESIQGDQGPPGDTGVSIQGDTGEPGLDGEQGPPGEGALDRVAVAGDTMTGDLITTDVVRTRDGAVTRAPEDGLISVITKTGGRTITFTRHVGEAYITGATDGSRTWTFLRDGDGFIDSWTVT